MKEKFISLISISHLILGISFHVVVISLNLFPEPFKNSPYSLFMANFTLYFIAPLGVICYMLLLGLRGRKAITPLRILTTILPLFFALSAINDRLSINKWDYCQNKVFGKHRIEEPIMESEKRGEYIHCLDTFKFSDFIDSLRR